MKKTIILIFSLIMTMTSVANNKPDSRQEGVGVSYHFQQVGNVNVFYREAGDSSKPTICSCMVFRRAVCSFVSSCPS